MTAPTPSGAVRNRGRWLLLWAPGLLVALGAAIATAHGLYEVAAAANVPGGIAWLYPLITDGLAVVAYIATARLTGRAARYAWAVVVAAAGLSGLAQAAYLAGGAAVDVAPALRFGIGAWPAIAAAVAAHLLHLLATTSPDGVQPDVAPEELSTVQEAVQPDPPTVSAVQPDTTGDDVQPAAPPGPAPAARPAPSPVRDRAEAAAERHARRHGRWPTVSELETAAEVSRGTAAAALKALRAEPLPAPHLITRAPSALRAEGPDEATTDAAKNTDEHDHDTEARTQP